MGKKRPNVKGKVCRHHPATPAITRCTTCFKPICRSCLVVLMGEDFCSRQCAEQHRQSSNSMSDHARKSRGADFRRKAGKVLFTLVLLGVLGGGAWLWFAHPDTVKSWVSQVREQIGGAQEKVDNAIEGAKAKSMEEPTDESQ